MATKNMTYVSFATEAIRLFDMLEKENENFLNNNHFDVAAMRSKAENLLEVQNNKKNSAKKKESKVSDETRERANAIKSALSDKPQTAAEINAVLGTDYTALQVSGAAKYIDGVERVKVTREVSDKGVTVSRVYTAYVLNN